MYNVTSLPIRGYTMNRVSNNITRMVEEFRYMMITKDIDLKRQEAEQIRQHLEHVKEAGTKEAGKGDHVDVRA